MENRPSYSLERIAEIVDLLHFPELDEVKALQLVQELRGRLSEIKGFDSKEKHRLLSTLRLARYDYIKPEEVDFSLYEAIEMQMAA